MSLMGGGKGGNPGGGRKKGILSVLNSRKDRRQGVNMNVPSRFTNRGTNIGEQKNNEENYLTEQKATLADVCRKQIVVTPAARKRAQTRQWNLILLRKGNKKEAGEIKGEEDTGREGSATRQIAVQKECAEVWSLL